MNVKNEQALALKIPNTPPTKPNIVIIGAGFAGMFCAKGLIGTNANVTLIDKQNHHLFQPLLYQVATGFLAISDVALPIRSIFHKEDNVEVVMAEVTSIDKENQLVKAGNNSYHYDHLVVATGAQYHFFGNDSWAPHVQVLKTISDAIGFRQNILKSFEMAESEHDIEKKRKLLTYVIIGGGPTGVEMAGATAELVNYALNREFRHITKEDVRLILVEASPRLLGTMPEKLSKYTLKALEDMGVEVHLESKVLDISKGLVKTCREELYSGTILWAAGVKPRPIAQWLGVETDKRGGVIVNKDMSVNGFDNIYVAGDASSFHQELRPLPALASVAKQQGKYLAELLSAKVSGNIFTKPFRYKDYGTMAIIGRHAAVADFKWIRFKGIFAAFLWGFVHVYFLMGWRNRMTVFTTWLWTWLTLGIGSRVILSKRKDNNELE